VPDITLKHLAKKKMSGRRAPSGRGKEGERTPRGEERQEQTKMNECTAAEENRRRRETAVGQSEKKKTDFVCLPVCL
jgi:hypothetical protein